MHKSTKRTLGAYRPFRPKIEVEITQRLPPPLIVKGEESTSKRERVKKDLKNLKNALSKRSLQGMIGPLHLFMKDGVDKDSEWTTIKRWLKELQLWKLFKVFSVTIGSLLLPPIGIVLIFINFLQRSKFYILSEGSMPTLTQYCAVDHYCKRQYPPLEQLTGLGHPDKIFFFLNSICINLDMHVFNAKHLQRAFGTKIVLLHCPSDGMIVDFLQIVLSRTLNIHGAISYLYSYVIYEALMKYPTTKQILFCHSRGAIVASHIIGILINHFLLRDELSRIEIYTIGGAECTYYQTVHSATNEAIPYYEHFVNKNDFSARLGVLGTISNTPGSIYMRDVEGHLLGEHYLPGIVNREYYEKNGRKTPRLYSYLANNRKIK